MVGRFSERDNWLARFVIGLTGHCFGIGDRLRNANWFLCGIGGAARLRFRLRSVPFDCWLRAFEIDPLLTLSVCQNREPLVFKLLSEFRHFGSHVLAAETTAAEHFSHLLAGLVTERFELRDLFVREFQLAGNVAVAEGVDAALLQRQLAIPSELFWGQRLFQIGIGLGALFGLDFGHLGHRGGAILFRGGLPHLPEQVADASVFSKLVADLANLSFLLVGQLEFFGVGISQQDPDRRSTTAEATSTTKAASASAAAALSHRG